METLDLATEAEQQLAQFASLIQDGINAWIRAGEIVVALLEKHGLSLQEIAERASLSEDIVARFEQLGRKQLAPQLLVANYPAAKHLVRLPYSEQCRLSGGGSVALLVLRDGAGADNINVEVKNLTPYQCRQVFSSNHIRSASEQRAWIESEREMKSITDTVVYKSPYKVIGKRVFFNYACELSASDLKRILTEMKS